MTTTVNPSYLRVQGIAEYKISDNSVLCFLYEGSYNVPGLLEGQTPALSMKILDI